MVIKMKKINRYNSFIEKRIINEFDDVGENSNIDLFQYATNKCAIEEAISIAYLLCPNFIKVKDYIFIEDFWNADDKHSAEKIETLEKQYNYDKKTIEMSVNSWSIGDLFIGCEEDIMDNEKVLKQFGNILIYNWSRRAKELFPERKFQVELGYEIMGELGLCITLYEK